MKKLLSILFFLSLFINVVAQTTFFEWENSNSSQYIYSAIELSDSTFILTGFNQNDIYSNNNACLIKLNKVGRRINERVEIGECRSSYSFPYSLNDLKTDIYVLKTTFGENETECGSEISICKIDKENLSEVIEKSSYFPHDRIAIPQDLILLNNEVIILGSYDIKESFTTKGFFLNKYSSGFEEVCSYYDTTCTDSNCPNGYGLINNLSELGIKVVLNAWDFQRTFTFNQNLELNSIKTNPKFATAFSSSIYNDTAYLITGVNYSFDPYLPSRIISTKKYNMNDVLIDSVFYCNTTDDTISYSGFGKNTLFSNNYIYITGTYNIIPTQWPYQQEPSWIELTIYDTALNKLKKCFYGGDAYYECWSITKTLDNAVLIAGNRYDHNEPGYLHHPFVLKVTSEGLLTASENEPEKRAHDAIVFPNPGTDYLSVQSGPQIFGATFELFDMNGRLVKQETISNQNTTISTTDLASGTYVWRIHYKNKEVESGKWVKSL